LRFNIVGSGGGKKGENERAKGGSAGVAFEKRKEEVGQNFFSNETDTGANYGL